MRTHDAPHKDYGDSRNVALCLPVVGRTTAISRSGPRTRRAGRTNRVCEFRRSRLYAHRAERKSRPRRDLVQALVPSRLDYARDRCDAAPCRGCPTYAAWLDREIVSAGTCAPTPHGLLLYGGATVSRARGRGAYRALLRARWDEAMARGTPALITQGGSMSRPILERLGFEPVGHVHMLLDEFGKRKA
jgi:hypothetical protein